MIARTLCLFAALALCASGCIHYQNATFANEPYQIETCKRIVRTENGSQYWLCKCFNVNDSLNRPKIILKGIPDSTFYLIEFQPR